MLDKTEIKEFKKSIIICCAVLLLIAGLLGVMLYIALSGRAIDENITNCIVVCAILSACALLLIAVIISSVISYSSAIKKSEELKAKAIEYEEQTLNSVKNRFEKYVEGLDNLGLDLDIDLIWYDQQNDPTDMSFTRIDFKRGYICSIGIQIRQKEEPKHKIDLEALSTVYAISMFGKTLFRYMFGLCSKYSRVPERMLSEYLNSAEDTVNKVINKGYDAVMQEIKEAN